MNNFTLTLSEQELNIVFNALAQRPFAEVQQVIMKIQNDVQKQVKEMDNGIPAQD